MKLLKTFVIYISLFLAVANGATLTDDFESGSKNGWTNWGTSLIYYGSPIDSHVLRINQELRWKSKIYDFGPSNANLPVTIEFDFWGIGGWESGAQYTDYVYVQVNGQNLVNGETIPGADGSNVPVHKHFSLTSSTDANGKVVLRIMYDVSAPSAEKALIDNFVLSTSSSATIDAVDDSYTTPPDNPLNANVLSNDIGTNIKVTSYTPPANGGSLSIQYDGNFTYTPPPGFIGTDTFTYTITDENNLTDTATVSIKVETVITNGVELPFYLINPPESRNLIGDYKIAGNTVLCLTELTDGYGGTCHGDTDYQNITSNMHVTKYLDIDNDPSTWNSTSSYVEIPNTYDTETGIIWAGLFWQGRISVDKNHPIHYAVENGSTYDFVEVGKGTSIGISQFDISQTGALDIKLKINSGGYNDVKANTFHVYESSNGQTYAAYANVTSLFGSNAISPGKNTFTVANLTTMEGREPSPGAFGGWSLVVIYAEDYTKGTPKNISIYNGFISINENNNPIKISGFRLPESGKIKAQLSVFSGEGEYRYGRTPYNNAQDWMKISDSETSGYEYMPGLTAGTHVGNRDNMFDARLDNILRDDIVNGVDNNLSTNNVGVDVDNYDVSTLMEQYRDANPLVDSVYIKMFSNNDYITPSMMAFSSELYVPKICYDYTFDIDGYVLDSSQNDVNTTLHLSAPDKPLRTHLLIRSLEGDFPLENAELTVSVKDKNMLKYIDGSVMQAVYNINEYEPASQLSHNVTDGGFSLYFGEGATPNQGGTMNANQSNYILFDYETNASQPRIETLFLFDVNFTVNYGSGPVSIYRHLDANSRCPTSTVYAPEWGIFNVISDATKPTTYNLITQVSSRNFDVHGIFYDADYETPKAVTTNIEIEMINANFFKSDTNASCNNPDSNITEPVYVSFNNSATTDAIPNTPDFALRNTAFRVWYLEDNKSTLVKNTCTSRNDETCMKTLYDSKFASFDTLCKSACDGTTNGGSCYSCLKKYYGKPLCSRDNFSIRPETFRITLYDRNSSNSKTMIIAENNSSAPVNIAADYNYTISMAATRYNSNQNAKKYIQGYGESLPAGKLEENSTIAGIMSNFYPGSNCADDANRTYSFTFWDGRSSSDLIHNNVGEYRFLVRDAQWTKVDNPGRWGQDCIMFPDQGYSSVQPSGKVGCIISSDHYRQDHNQNEQYYDLNLFFKTYEFNVSAITLSAPNDSFIYMNNLTDDYNMSIRVEGDIVAKGANGMTLTNFSKGCYGVDMNLTFERSLNPAENTLASPTLLRYYDINNSETNTTNNKDVDKIAFTRITSGVTKADLAINFDRNSSVSVNPIELNITAIKVECANSAQCTSFADMNASHEARGELAYPVANPFRRYVYYGRVHAPDYRTEEDSIDTPIYAEVYCDSILVNCADFNISRENGWRESVDSRNWWINPLHTAADGNITALEARKAFVKPDNSVEINGVNPYNALKHSPPYSPTVEYIGAAKPYRARILVEADPWLKFHKYFADGRIYYDVLFQGKPNDWAGIGTLGKTVDANASGSSSRRIEW